MLSKFHYMIHKVMQYWLVIWLLGLSCSATQHNDTALTRAVLEKRLTELSNRAVQDLAKVPIDSTRIPRALHADRTLRASKSKEWTSGFYAGMLWELYQFSGNEKLRRAAERWTAFQEKEKWDTRTHDLGFKIYCSFGKGYDVNHSEHYKNVILDASRTLIKRYNPTVGAIRSWDWNTDVWQFPVIIDNMMNLEMLFAATAFSKDSTFYHVARQHALTTLQHHFRPNYSSYHVIDYDTLTGAVRNRHTHQGAAHESAWARGQAWGLYGFTMAYGATREPRFLALAQNIADFYFQHPHLPPDYIPYWDFDAPRIPDEPRDASAAAVMASGLLELYHLDPANQNQYLAWADRILHSLATPAYQSHIPPFLLQHSVGSIPGAFEVDVPIIYADYYYVEALLRRLKIEKMRGK